MKTTVYEEIIKRVSINTAGVIDISTYGHNSLLIHSKINGTFNERTIDTLKRIFDCDVKFCDNGNKNIIVVTMDVPNVIAFVDKDVPADESEVDDVSCGFLSTIIEIEEED
jgi:hypothetical protein